MKKLFTIVFILVGFIAHSQNASPLPNSSIKKLIAPNNPIFYYNTADSAVWMFKGQHAWNKFDLSNTNELDSIYCTNTSLWYSNRDTLTILTDQDVTPYSATANTNYTHNVSAHINANISTNTNISITLSNLNNGKTGNIEITYTGAAVVTFIVGSSYTLNVSPNILGTITNAHTNTLKSKSSGTYITSYYRSGNNIYINGR
jgi:hypothetical protein